MPEILIEEHRKINNILYDPDSLILTKLLTHETGMTRADCWACRIMIVISDKPDNMSLIKF